ncbi:MAG: hypothetical protein KDA85_11755 [Planctomycetaceae bacterium]|nr:hypothetical protein [Planctomycetaceae bacterium]
MSARFSIHRFSGICAVLLVTGWPAIASIDNPVYADDGDTLPIREVSIFKDGHAFLTHQGNVTPDEKGYATLDYVPTPLIGTFWVRSSDAANPLASASVGMQRTSLVQPVRRIRDLLYANEGAEAIIEEKDEKYAATILGANPESEIILLKTDQGTRAVPIDSVTQVTFPKTPALNYQQPIASPRITLAFDPAKRGQTTASEVTMTYLQRGIRWIPAYRVLVTDRGVVEIELQATVINDLADLDDVTARLLVGVPSFAFQDTVDPISLKTAVEGLSLYFQRQSSGNPQAIATNFSNSLMIQSQGFSPVQQFAPVQVDATGTDPGTEQSSEDIYVFSVPHLTLPKGHRTNLILGKWELPFEDVYKLTVTGNPPPEITRYTNNSIDPQLQQQLAAPKVEHVLRIRNTTTIPLTTAPILFLNQQTVLAQGMMTYTAPGSPADVTLTKAVGISSSFEETETDRQAERRLNQNFHHVKMNGSIRLINAQKSTVHIEVIRNAMGTITTADHDAKIVQLGPAQVMSDPDFRWFSWYSWPYWWHRYNSLSRAVWKVEIPAGESLDLQYAWQYTWTE